MNDQLLFAIVAEYREVALLEKPGNVRSLWDGKERLTDGKTYIFFKSDDPDNLGLWQFNSERDAKSFIDVYRDNHSLLPDKSNPLTGVPIKSKPLLNYKQAYLKLCHRPWKGEVPKYIFNEELGAFTFFNGVRDGQHRHKGIK